MIIYLPKIKDEKLYRTILPHKELRKNEENPTIKMKIINIKKPAIEANSITG